MGQRIQLECFSCGETENYETKKVALVAWENGKAHLYYRDVEPEDMLLAAEILNKEAEKAIRAYERRS